MPTLREEAKVSINSTSEEVRSGGCILPRSNPNKVSINSTSEEVRSTDIPTGDISHLPVSINSTSEEVRSIPSLGIRLAIDDTKFPLIQLPRKSEVIATNLHSGDTEKVSINSTSEEVRSKPK